ncbi:hypothetical protein CRG98_047731 [Punica granatum]|uniref:Uncharacterized protein n=1 Tax=Punica granatum TaxID=22663 RepID=A0A2I0HJI4_PUNGR|nr:hypothetical protein CRG98_047731 [Punica granatum]
MMFQTFRSIKVPIEVVACNGDSLPHPPPPIVSWVRKVLRRIRKTFTRGAARIRPDPFNWASLTFLLILRSTPEPFSLPIEERGARETAARRPLVQEPP